MACRTPLDFFKLLFFEDFVFYGVRAFLQAAPLTLPVTPLTPGFTAPEPSRTPPGPPKTFQGPPQSAPRCLQNRILAFLSRMCCHLVGHVAAKTRPRRQDDVKIAFRCQLEPNLAQLRPILGLTWPHLGPPDLPKTCIFIMCFMVLAISPICVLRRPREPQDGPDRSPRGLKRAPRALQKAPRWPQEAPKRGARVLCEEWRAIYRNNAYCERAVHNL